MSHHEGDKTRSSDANRATLERMFAALQARDWDALAADFADDFVQEWPQSGERLEGREHCLTIYRNYPGGPPSIEPKRLTGSGDAWTVESLMRYGDQEVHGISIFEFRDGKVVAERDYWADPFEPPAWRSQWVVVD